ncbi:MULTISPECIES: phthiocerol/phthiodiolone dimycocerosyl transferase family protein [Streptomyces]|uniref:phthiocerol/phthiodiolone dimycocerosyl transferase family protein n=1 Tax=Streptomyces TaxID=1883 RepID=UPI0004CC8661|nr:MULTISPECIES: condensation domain-containing protein [Streptomyces]
MSTWRPISDFEAPYFHAGSGPDALPLHDMALHLGSTVSERLDPASVEQALDALRTRHPLLRCLPEQTGTAAVLRLRPDAEPWLSVHEVTDEQFEAAYLRSLNDRPDWRQGLFGARLFLCGDRSRVTLLVHHGVADGVSGLALVRRFWEAYRAVRRGDPASGAPVTDVIPPAVDTVLASAFPEHDLDPLAVAPQIPPVPPLLLHEDAQGTGSAALRFVPRRHLFSRRQTARLRQLARRRGITLNSLLTGALLTAVRAERPDVTAPAGMLCGHAVDLRSARTPALTGETLVNCVGGIATPAEVSLDDPSLRIAAHVDDLVKRMRKESLPERLMLAALRNRSAQAQSAAPRVSCGISNLGEVAPIPGPSGTPVDLEVHGNAPGMPPKLCVYTYDGRLTVQHEYDSRVHADATMASLRHRLTTDLAGLAADAA